MKNLNLTVENIIVLNKDEGINKKVVVVSVFRDGLMNNKDNKDFPVISVVRIIKINVFNSLGIVVVIEKINSEDLIQGKG